MSWWDRPPDPPPGLWAEDPRNPYLTNLRHPVILMEYIRYKQERGFPLNFPISDGERLTFDMRMVEKYAGKHVPPERVRFRYHEIARRVKKAEKEKDA